MKHALGLTILALTLGALLLGGCDSQEASKALEALFEDNFEATECLSKWTVGGRQQEGTNTANCEVRNGSTVGHLFKFSYTEITLAPARDRFPFSDDLTFSFDMEVRVSSTGGAPSNYYGSSGVRFDFYDAAGTVLGRVSYIAATTTFPYQDAAEDPTRAAIQIAEGAFRSHALSAGEIVSHIDVEEDEVATVGISFRTYSSTRPIPHVEAELWIDNVRIAPSE